MKGKNIFFIFMFLMIPVVCYASETASQILDKTIKILNNSNGIKSEFEIFNSGNSALRGTFSSSSQKFKIETPISTTWYDGKNMWTSNSRSKQITLFTPTLSEINEVNPFAYINSYNSKFNSSLISGNGNSYIVRLIPKSKKENIKSVEISINKKTYLPEKFVVIDKNSSKTTVSVTGLKIKVTLPSSTFVCPVSTMKGYELVDLR